MPYYFNSTRLYNAPIASFKKGGRVPFEKNMTKQQKTHDSVRAVLTPGGLVVPVRGYGMPKGQLVRDVVTYLHHRGVKLPNT